MELQTTVRNFVHAITYYHIASDTRIRVIIDEPQIRREPASSDIFSVLCMTPTEQRQHLNRLPHDYDPHASDELVALIEASHTNTDLIEW